jgi:hypothetical protein
VQPPQTYFAKLVIHTRYAMEPAEDMILSHLRI